VQQVNYADLRKQLLASGQVLHALSSGPPAN
jgi:hypothetical protein